VLSEREAGKLAQRVGDLLANDAQFAAAMPDENICETILRPGISWSELMRAVAEGYPDRPALGQRATRIVTTEGCRRLELLPRYDTVTYRELWQRVTAIAAALSDGFVGSGDRVATLGFCSVDYTAVDMSVPLLGGVSVPLHAGAPVSQLQTMVDEAEPSVIACSAEYLDAGVTLAIEGSRPQLVLVFDFHHDVDAHRDALEAARCRLADGGGRVRLETLSQTVERGRGLPAPPGPAADDDRLAVIVYTSGSSGSPKGAMQPEGLAKSVWTVTAGVLVERGFAIPALTLNYMPMSHTAGRAMLYSTLGAGGTAYFAGTSDLSTILADLQMVRPTQLNFVPRVWELLYREFLSELANHDQHASEDEVLADLRARVLGGRYISALTGSAPISADLAAWVERLIDSHLMNALGATESGSVVVDGKVQRPPITDYKLVDVPELGYFSTDRPHPRGELLIKSRTLFGGYYKRPALTAEVFDESGYYRTGDVVAELGTDELRYVDRRNNVLKLSQGEFVTVSKLEAIYANCEPVHQIYVYGNGEQAYLLAVVVPTAEALAEHRIDDLKPLILQSLQQAAKDAELEPYEIPRDVIVELAPFTLENGLLSGIRKPSRPNLKKCYGERLEHLCAELAYAQQTRLQMLRDQTADRPVIETVCAAAGALLGGISDDPKPTSQFADLGGDSLSALTFANSLEDIFGIPVPVSVIISPASDLQSVAEHIMARRETGPTRPTFTSVHGSDVAEVHAGELTLDKFIDAETLDRAGDLAPPVPDVRTVLLTGATGYLGRYLALEWLEGMDAVDGTVICLVRAKDGDAARARLDAVFDSGDAALLSRYRTLAADHLEVLAGDKADSHLGLDQATWQRLADTVDLIIDPAALVNHMLPYQQLFEPNVVGTAELIRLALTTRQKPFAYVSTIGVGATIAPGDFDEDADVRIAGATRAIDDNYANGYATSKWAGEVLLREAHDLCGLPVSVFRCDMIMAETSYHGQLNLPDMVTRLILSIAATGLAPESFYVRDPSGVRPRAHFDGLPVDFVAESISTVAADGSGDFKGFRTFHVMNPHDDGVGLDEYVDWMVQAGCRVDRIGEYDEWIRRFESALRNLPERQRQASLLPLLVSFRHPQPPLAGAFAPTPRFRAAVANAGIGVDGDIPQIDKSIIEKYLSDLELLGLLDPAHRAAARKKEK
jgi:fatty acid CoA ligase FadD9